MIITRLAIEYDRVTWALLAFVVIAGLQIFKEMPRAYDPGFVIRTAQVVTQFPGASAERVEALITSPIEEVVKEIPELDFVQSESRSGVSIVSVNISEAYTNMRPIWDDLRRKVDNLPTALPEGASTPQVNDDFGDVYGIVVGLTGEGFTFRELEELASKVREAKEQLECSICMERAVTTVLNPCGRYYCGDCASAVNSCYTCLQPVAGKTRLYLG